MAKEKQEPYEFLSNLVLALMATDRIFSNSFFTSELDYLSQNTGGDKTGRGYVYLSVCARDPVYDGVSSFNHPDGYVAEGVKNRISFQL